MISLRALLVLTLSLWAQASIAQHRLITQGNNKLAIIAANGDVEWEMPWAAIHDIHVLTNGHIMVQRDRMGDIVEIDPITKSVVWNYHAAKRNGNEGRRIEVHAFQPLPNGHLMIAESGAERIIEVDRDGTLVSSIQMQLNKPNAHSDTRLVRKLANGNVLACHEKDGVVREYSDQGELVWEFEIPLFDKPRKGGHGPEAWGNQVFCALRLANGNTLMGTGNGHSVLEVSPDKTIVWQLHQDDLPDIRLAWVTTLEVLPNGHYVIGNCHAGVGQPMLVEIDPRTKTVVWTFAQFERFGNSMSNSQLLDVGPDVIR
ncbi:MAG: outer membrane protein assembly factor BamB [Candidatus Promineifilaceae bacterium]|jgi:outer membrane protein assembly factor BamB